MVTKKTNTIGLILPDISNPYFPEIARGIEDAAKKEGYNVFLCNTDDDSHKEAGYITVLKERQVDGMIFTVSALKSSQVISKYVGNMPFVLVDGRPEEFLNAPGVFLDNFDGGYIGTKHLIDKGHREIVFISGPLQFYNAQQRLKGYYKAFEEKGLKINRDLIIEGNFKRSCGFEIIEKLIRDNTIFSAVFASNDLMAVGAMEALRDAEIDIPGQVAVVGFDDIYLSKVVTPRLTTVSQPTYQMGVKAAEMLLTIIKEVKITKKQKFFSSQLVIRESS